MGSAKKIAAPASRKSRTPIWVVEKPRSEIAMIDMEESTNSRPAASLALEAWRERKRCRSEFSCIKVSHCLYSGGERSFAQAEEHLTFRQEGEILTREQLQEGPLGVNGDKGLSTLTVASITRQVGLIHYFRAKDESSNGWQFKSHLRVVLEDHP